MQKVRVGFIGAGGMAHAHAAQLLEVQEAQIIAVCDVNEKNAEALVSRHNLQGVSCHSDYRLMLNRDQPDAVIICTPHTLHHPQAIDALKAGCHVLIEKPMATSYTDATGIIREAERQGKVLQVSYQRHFQPEFQYIKQAIEEGVIGQLTSVTASLHQEWAQLSKSTWRQEPALSGGGMLMDSGSHILDVLLWTTGLTPLNVRSCIRTHGSPVELDSFTAIEFDRGVSAAVSIIGFAPCWHETYVYCGDKGGIFYDNGRITIRRMGESDEQPQLPPALTNADRSFIEAVLGRIKVPVPGEFAQRVVKLTERIYEAAGYTPIVHRNS